MTFSTPRLTRPAAISFGKALPWNWSGHGSGATLETAAADDYVAKPLAVDDLIPLFKKHLPQDVQPTM